MHTRPLAVVTAALAAVTLTIGATSATASVDAKKAKAPFCASKTKKKATKAIKHAWDQVFNGSLGLPLEEKFLLVEGSEDPEFNAVLQKVAAANAAMLDTTSAKVNTVTCAGKKEATVVWDLVLAGTPAVGLAPPGVAVLDGKIWKVGQTTVCDLFALADPTLTQSGPCADIAAGV